MNRCHPYAQCIYVTSTADYECRCNQGYEGDGMECIKTGTFFRHLLHLRFSFRIYRIHRVFLREENTRETRVSSTNSQFPVVLNAEVSCLEVDICDPNASCQQEESLAKCVCNPGFEGDGTMCSPIGHISYLSYLSSSSLSLSFLYRSSTRRKHPHPRKILLASREEPRRVRGMHDHIVISCKRKNAVPICSFPKPVLLEPGLATPFSFAYTDECSSSSYCLENERCLYNSASSRYECTCNPGYSMVDSRCVVSDCSTNPSQCHVNAQCTSIGEGGYRCVCAEGYNGDGIRQCVEDHIGCNVLNNCGRNAVCGYNQTSANFVCVCQQVCLLNPQIIRPRYYRFLGDRSISPTISSLSNRDER